MTKHECLMTKDENISASRDGVIVIGWSELKEVF